MTEDLTTIKIRKETANSLKEIGKKGETYDDIVNRLSRQSAKKKEVITNATESS